MDLSKLSDEQLEAYQSLKGGGGAPTPPAGMPSLMPGTPNSDAAGRFAENFASAVNPVPGIRSIVNDASNPQIGLGRSLKTHLVDPQLEQFGKSSDAAKGTGEFEHMTPLSRLSSAVGHGVAGALPLVGPAAANAGDQIGGGDVAGGLGSASGLIASGAAPDVIRGTGRALMRTAEPIAENAAGIAYTDRAHGRTNAGPGMTPGRFALDYTNGAVRPSTVESNANRSLSDINRRLENVVGASPNQVNIQPAQSNLQQTINTATGANSKITPQRLEPLRSFLNDAEPGFNGNTQYPPGANTPITIIQNPASSGPAYIASHGPSPQPTVVSPTQPPRTGLDMARAINTDFVRNWNPQTDTKGMLGSARSAYHDVREGLHQAVPESRPLDIAASAGIPVAERSSIKALRAGPVQNTLNKFGAHTGALAGAIYGGTQYGLPGAIAGIAVPEMLANPTVQMIAARGLDYPGKAMSSPLVSGPTAPLSRPTAMPVGRAIQAAPLVKPKKGEQ